MKPEDQKVLGQAAAILADLSQDLMGYQELYFEDEAAREIEVTAEHLEQIAKNLKHLCQALRFPQANDSVGSAWRSSF